jgi:hypothetical protein
VHRATDPTTEQGLEVPLLREQEEKDEEASAVETPGELSAGGRLRRAGWRGEEAGFATGGNATNPRIGSGMKQAREIEEEQAVEVVRNHEDGTREGVATLSEGRESGREWTLRLTSMEGQIFGQPQERNPAMRVVGSQGPEGVGKDGTKVRRVAQSPMEMEDRGPVEGPSRTRTRERPKVVEGGGEGQRTMTSIGSSPHGMHPV